MQNVNRGAKMCEDQTSVNPERAQTVVLGQRLIHLIFPMGLITVANQLPATTSAFYHQQDKEKQCDQV